MNAPQRFATHEPLETFDAERELAQRERPFKLKLEKETVKELSNDELDKVAGGAMAESRITCIPPPTIIRRGDR